MFTVVLFEFVSGVVILEFRHDALVSKDLDSLAQYAGDKPNETLYSHENYYIHHWIHGTDRKRRGIRWWCFSSKCFLPEVFSDANVNFMVKWSISRHELTISCVVCKWWLCWTLQRSGNSHWPRRWRQPAERKFELGDMVSWSQGLESYVTRSHRWHDLIRRRRAVDSSGRRGFPRFTKFKRLQYDNVHRRTTNQTPWFELPVLNSDLDVGCEVCSPCSSAS